MEENDLDLNYERDEYDEEPLFADDIEDDDDIPLPPSPINEDAYRQRAREVIVASRRDRANQDDVDDTGPEPQGQNTSALNDTAEQTVPIKKKKPVLKLGPERLTGERGFKALYEEFPKIKFKGNGHETSDLALLLQRYELWAHRLFPKMTFRDVLDRVEKLEKDKEVKSCLNQMRYGRDFRATVEDSDSDGETTAQHQMETEVDNDTTAGISVLNGPTNHVTDTGQTLHVEEHESSGPPLTVGSGEVDSDSDEEWNMLGRRGPPQTSAPQSGNEERENHSQEQELDGSVCNGSEEDEGRSGTIDDESHNGIDENRKDISDENRNGISWDETHNHASDVSHNSISGGSHKDIDSKRQNEENHNGNDSGDSHQGISDSTDVEIRGPMSHDNHMTVDDPSSQSMENTDTEAMQLTQEEMDSFLVDD